MAAMNKYVTPSDSAERGPVTATTQGDSAELGNSAQPGDAAIRSNAAARGDDSHASAAGSTANAADRDSAPPSEPWARPWARLLGSKQLGFVRSEKVERMGDRKTWPEICHAEEYQGRWVALDHCRYDQTTMQPIEGDVVDSDDDLGSLCSRMREAGMSSCAIRFCDSEEVVEVPSSRVSGSEFRAAAR